MLAKIQREAQIMKEADIFESWANNLVEGTWALPDTPEKMDQLKMWLSEPHPVGPDASDAKDVLGDYIGDDNLFDQLEELAEEDPDADAVPLVMAWIDRNRDEFAEIAELAQNLEAAAAPAAQPAPPPAADAAAPQIAPGPQAVAESDLFDSNYKVMFVDSDGVVEDMGKVNTPAEATELIQNHFDDIFDTGDRLRKVAPNIFVLETDYTNTGERATLDNYKDFYHWIIRPEQPPAVAEDSMEEGLGSKLAGLGLAGAMALGAGGANARVMPGDDPSINRLTGKPVVTQQATDNAPAKAEAPKGFSKEYLQSVVDGKHPRPMVSVEKAKELLNNMQEGVAEGPDALQRMREMAGMPVAESRMIDESGETLMHVLDRFRHEVAQFEQGADLDDNLYDALYDYYVNKGEMPYGTAKARSGDPYEWVSDRLDQELGTGNHTMRAVPEADAISTFEVMSGFDAPVAEGACNMTREGSYCPEHGLAECGGGMYESREGDAVLARIKSLALIR